MRTRDILFGALLMALLGVSGCRSAPPEVGASHEPDLQDLEKDALEKDKLDKKVEAAARRLSRIERDGVVYYCKRDRQIGTNLSALKCMTESQLRVEIETMDKYRDDMRNRAGKCNSGSMSPGGPCGAY